jgi:hypothetical protein
LHLEVAASGIIQAITSLTYNRTTAMWLSREGAATAAPAANADPVRPIRKAKPSPCHRFPLAR